ncbi:hypothetical protein ACFQU7_19230 [Pseudoroseomonas wenyumeiae]
MPPPKGAGAILPAQGADVFTQTSLTARIVAAGTRWPWLTLLLALLLALGAGFYSSRHFALTADTAELIATDLPWRQGELAYEANFPSCTTSSWWWWMAPRRSWPKPAPPA